MVKKQASAIRKYTFGTCFRHEPEGEDYSDRDGEQSDDGEHLNGRANSVHCDVGFNVSRRVGRRGWSGHRTDQS